MAGFFESIAAGTPTPTSQLSAPAPTGFFESLSQTPQADAAPAPPPAPAASQGFFESLAAPHLQVVATPAPTATIGPSPSLSLSRSDEGADTRLPLHRRSGSRAFDEARLRTDQWRPQIDALRARDPAMADELAKRVRMVDAMESKAMNGEEPPAAALARRKDLNAYLQNKLPSLIEGAVNRSNEGRIQLPLSGVDRTNAEMVKQAQNTAAQQANDAPEFSPWEDARNPGLRVNPNLFKPVAPNTFAHPDLPGSTYRLEEGADTRGRKGMVYRQVRGSIGPTLVDPNEELTYLEEGVHSVGRMAGGLVRGAGGAVGAAGLTSTGEAIVGAGETMLETHAASPSAQGGFDEGKWKPKWWIANMGQAGSQLALQTAMAVLTRGQGTWAQTAAFLGPVAVQEGGNVYADEIQRGASHQTAATEALLVGTVNASIEKLSFGTITAGSIPGLRETIRQKAKGEIRRRIMAGGVVAAENSLEEMAQTLVPAVINDVIGQNPEAYKDLRAQLETAGVIGAAVGAPTGVITGGGINAEDAAPPPQTPQRLSPAQQAAQARKNVRQMPQTEAQVETAPPPAQDSPGSTARAADATVPPTTPNAGTSETPPPAGGEAPVVPSNAPVMQQTAPESTQPTVSIPQQTEWTAGTPVILPQMELAGTVTGTVGDKVAVKFDGATGAVLVDRAAIQKRGETKQATPAPAAPTPPADDTDRVLAEANATLEGAKAPLQGQLANNADLTQPTRMQTPQELGITPPQATMPPVSTEQGAGRTSPPEQAPQRPGGYKPPSEADLDGPTIDLWHGTSAKAWEAIKKAGRLKGGSRGRNASAEVSHASQYPEDTGAEVIILTRADTKSLDVDPNDQIGETVAEGLFPRYPNGEPMTDVSSVTLGKHAIVAAFDVRKASRKKDRSGELLWRTALQNGDFAKAEQLGVRILKSFDQPAPAASGAPAVIAPSPAPAPSQATLPTVGDTVAFTLRGKDYQGVIQQITPKGQRVIKRTDGVTSAVEGDVELRKVETPANTETAREQGAGDRAKPVVVPPTPPAVSPAPPVSLRSETPPASETPTRQDLERLGLIRKWGDRWQYRTDIGGKWYYANSEESAAERAAATYTKTPSEQRLTPAQLAEKADADQFADMDSRYGRLSLAEAKAMLDKAKGVRGTSPDKEFNGSGGRRTGVATANQGARDAGEFALQMGIYLKERVRREIADGKPVPPEVLADYPDLAPSEKSAPSSDSPPVSSNQPDPSPVTQTKITSRADLAAAVKRVAPQIPAKQVDDALTAMDAVFQTAARRAGLPVSDLYARALAEVTSAPPTQNGQEMQVQGKNAATSWLADGRAIVRLFESGNASSILHEMGHIVRRRILADYYPAEHATLESHYGVKDGKWTTAQEERFARDVERYSYAGRAPTPTLSKVFARIKVFMRDIYTALKGSPLPERMNPTVAKVLDTVYGRKTPDELAMEKAERSFKAQKAYHERTYGKKERGKALSAIEMLRRQAEADGWYDEGGTVDAELGTRADTPLAIHPDMAKAEGYSDRQILSLRQRGIVDEDAYTNATAGMDAAQVERYNQRAMSRLLGDRDELDARIIKHYLQAEGTDAPVLRRLAVYADAEGTGPKQNVPIDQFASGDRFTVGGREFVVDIDREGSVHFMDTDTDIPYAESLPDKQMKIDRGSLDTTGRGAAEEAPPMEEPPMEDVDESEPTDDEIDPRAAEAMTSPQPPKLTGKLANLDPEAQKRIADLAAQLRAKMGGGGKQPGDDILFQSAATAGASTVNARQAERLWLEQGTDSPFFKRWFKGSKVVGKDGNPQVVYHGTDADFTAFDASKSGSTTGNWGWYGKGFSFTSAPWIGSQYTYDRTGGNVKPVYLSIQKPFVIIDTPDHISGAGGKAWAVRSAKHYGILSTHATEADAKAAASDYTDPANVYVAHNKDAKPARTLIQDLLALNGLTPEEREAIARQGRKYADEVLKFAFGYSKDGLTMDASRSVRFRELLEQNGYDGVIVEKDGHKEYLVLSPEQIKSALANKGTFDAADPDILYQDAPPAELDPDTFRLALTLGRELRTAGVLSFDEFAQQMRQLVGDAALPHIKGLYANLWMTADPDLQAQMTDLREVNTYRLADVTARSAMPAEDDPFANSEEVTDDAEPTGKTSGPQMGLLGPQFDGGITGNKSGELFADPTVEGSKLEQQGNAVARTAEEAKIAKKFADTPTGEMFSAEPEPTIAPAQPEPPVGGIENVTAEVAATLSETDLADRIAKAQASYDRLNEQYWAAYKADSQDPTTRQIRGVRNAVGDQLDLLKAEQTHRAWGLTLADMKAAEPFAVGNPTPAFAMGVKAYLSGKDTPPSRPEWGKTEIVAAKDGFRAAKAGASPIQQANRGKGNADYARDETGKKIAEQYKADDAENATGKLFGPKPNDAGALKAQEGVDTPVPQGGARPAEGGVAPEKTVTPQTESPERQQLRNAVYDAPDYGTRVARNLQFIGTPAEDWHPIAVKRMVTTTDDQGNTVSMPEFDFPQGYTPAKTAFSHLTDGCELCGHAIKHVYHIQNDVTKQTMMVGSECVTHFGEGKSGQRLSKEAQWQANRDLFKSVEDARNKIGEAFGAPDEMGNWTKRPQDSPFRSHFNQDAYTLWDQLGKLIGNKSSRIDPKTKQPDTSDAALSAWEAKQGDLARELIAKADAVYDSDAGKKARLLRLESQRDKWTRMVKDGYYLAGPSWDRRREAFKPEDIAIMQKRADDLTRQIDELRNPPAKSTEALGQKDSPTTSATASPTETPPDMEPQPADTARAILDTPAKPDNPVSLADQEVADNGPSIHDFGEKIGGARKDTARPLGPRVGEAVERDTRPAWQKKFIAVKDVKTGEWFIAHESGSIASRQSFKTEEEAERNIPLIAVAQRHGVQSYTADGKESYGIYRKLGERKRPIVKGGFATREDAMKYLATHPEEILNHKFPFPERPWLDRIDRTGPTVRSGDVSPTDFQKAFGFRAGEFGNWNMGGDGQAALNFAYDALHDLARALNVPPKALSLNGELAIAFGARGTGGVDSAAAHYERDYGVINLTKIRGAGSLAHEWFHALDHYLGRLDGKASAEREDGRFKAKSPERDYLTSGYSYDSKMRQELLDKFKQTVRTMTAKETDEVIDTTKADKGVERAGEYLTNITNELRRSMTYDWSGSSNPRLAKKKPATPDQLARWDALVERLMTGDVGEKINVTSEKSKYAYRSSYQPIEDMNALFKEVTGRSFATMDQNSRARTLYWQVNSLLEARNRVAKASEGATEKRKASTDFYREARDIDGFRASDYWSTPHEMGARAFEAYIADKLREAGNESQYLTHGADNRYYAFLGMKPYPEGAERQAINAAFDAFWQTAKTKTDEATGNVTLYQSAATAGASPAEVEQATGNRGTFDAENPDILFQSSQDEGEPNEYTGNQRVVVGREAEANQPARDARSGGDANPDARSSVGRLRAAIQLLGEGEQTNAIVPLRWSQETDDLLSAELPDGNLVTILYDSQNPEKSEAQIEIMTKDAVTLSDTLKATSLDAAKQTAQKMVDDMARKQMDAMAQSPDWRPEQSMPEDYYTLFQDAADPTKPPAQRDTAIAEPPPEDATGIKNAAVDEALAAMGMEPAQHGPRMTFEDARQQAKDQLAADPYAGINLVRELMANPRPITPQEDMLLLHEQTRLKLARDAAEAEMVQAVRSGDAAAQVRAKAKVEQTRKDYATAADVETYVGTLNAQGLAFRRAMMKDDYSLAAIERAWTARKGAPLTEQELAEAKAMSQRLIATMEEMDRVMGEQQDRLAIAEAERDHEKLLREAAQTAAPDTTPPHIRLFAEQVKARVDREAQASRAVLAAKPDKASLAALLNQLPAATADTLYQDAPTTLSPEQLLKHLATIGYEHLLAGKTEPDAWRQAMLDELGDVFAPHLDRIRAATDAMLAKDLRAIAPGSRATATAALAKQDWLGKMKARAAEGAQPAELREYFRRLALDLIRSGVKERDPLLEALHAKVSPLFPDLTPTQTRDILSGYGLYTPLDPAADKATLRDIQQQSQKLAQLEALERGQAPAKTGVERQPPNAETRALTKLVNEAKKKAGVTAADPARQLQTALASMKTRARNRIADLQREIDLGVRTVQGKRVPISDAELDSLKAELARVRAAHAEVFKAGLTDEQRLALATRAAKANFESWRTKLEQARKGIFAAAAPGRKLTSPEIEAMRAQATAARTEFEELEALANPPRAASEKREDALRKQINALSERIRTGSLSPENRTRMGPDTAGVDALKKQRSALATQLAVMRANDPVLQAKAQAEAYARQAAEFERRAKAGAFTTPSRAPVPTSEEVTAAMARRDTARAYFQQLRDADPAYQQQRAEASNRAYRAMLARQEADIRQRMATDDYGPKPPRERKHPLDEASLKAKAAFEAVKLEDARKRHAFDLANRSMARKIWDAAMEPLDVSKAIKSAFDLSAPLRQGAVFTFGHPILAAGNAGQMLKAVGYSPAGLREAWGKGLKETLTYLAYGNGQAARLLDTKLRTRATAKAGEDAKLDLTSLDDPLSPHEEAIRSRWSDYIPGIPQSNRAFTTFLNLQRAQLFDLMMAATPNASKAEARALAHFTNVATGRGEVAGLERAMSGLSHILWSPKLLLSRVQLLAGQPLYGGSLKTRRAIAKEYARSLIGLAAFYGLVHLAGMMWDDDDEEKPTVTFDPRSSDFGKVKMGNTRMDPLAGVAQVTVLLSRLGSGAVADADGNVTPITGEARPYGAPTPTSLLGKFFQSKLSPTISTPISWLQGQDAIGEPMTPTQAAADLVTPLSVGDINTVLQEHGLPKGAALSLLSIFGMGMQHYQSGGPEKAIVNRVVRGLRNPDATKREAARGELQSALTSGAIRPTQISVVRERLSEGDAAFRWKKMSVEELRWHWDRASPQDRKAMLPILYRKIRDADRLTPAQKGDMARKIMNEYQASLSGRTP